MKRVVVKLNDVIVGQTQGADADVDAWVASGGYSEEHVFEYTDLDNDYDYLLEACRLKRASEYPSVGDQLDAAYKARHGDSSDQEVIDLAIATVKSNNPKPVAP